MSTDEYLKYFGLMLENAPIPVMIVDEEGVIRHINESMKSQFGDISGRHRSFLFANYDTELTDFSDTQDEKALKTTGFSDPFAEVDSLDPYMNLRIDVTLADVAYEAVVQKVIDEDGKSLLVMAFEDVSEKKHLEDTIAASLNALKRETSIAKDIQSSILPLNGIYLDLVRFSGIYLPAGDLSGDIYDVIELDEDDMLFYVADVSGHGIQASLLTIYLRENIRAMAKTGKTGLDILMRDLLTSFKALDIDAMLYISLLLLRYNARTHELSVTNAGHNCYPLILRENGRIEELPIKGMPLSKISESSSYSEEIIGIRPGDRVILYTDGLIEEYSMSMKGVFGPEGMRKTVSKYSDRNSYDLAKIIVEESAAYMLMNAKDDRTIVIADILK